MDREFRVVIKTKRALYAELESAIKKSHPYTVPQIIGNRGACAAPSYACRVQERQNGGYDQAVTRQPHEIAQRAGMREDVFVQRFRWLKQVTRTFAGWRPKPKAPKEPSMLLTNLHVACDSEESEAFSITHT